MRRSRSGQADDDDRRRKLDLERFGVATHEILESQPCLEQTDQPLPHDVAAEPRQPHVGLDGSHLRREPVEQARVSELAQPRCTLRIGNDAVDRQIDLNPERELVEGLLFRGALRFTQVLDPHLSHHGVRVLPARHRVQPGRPTSG